MPKTYLQSTINTKIKLGVATLNILYGRVIGIDEIITICETHHPHILSDKLWD